MQQIIARILSPWVLIYPGVIIVMMTVFIYAGWHGQSTVASRAHSSFIDGAPAIAFVAAGAGVLFILAGIAIMIHRRWQDRNSEPIDAEPIEDVEEELRERGEV